jgi:hypothetical protein
MFAGISADVALGLPASAGSAIGDAVRAGVASILDIAASRVSILSVNSTTSARRLAAGLAVTMAVAADSSAEGNAFLDRLSTEFAPGVNSTAISGMLSAIADATGLLPSTLTTSLAPGAIVRSVAVTVLKSGGLPLYIIVAAAAAALLVLSCVVIVCCVRRQRVLARAALAKESASSRKSGDFRGAVNPAFAAEGRKLNARASMRNVLGGPTAAPYDPSPMPSNAPRLPGRLSVTSEKKGIARGRSNMAMLLAAPEKLPAALPVREAFRSVQSPLAAARMPGRLPAGSKTTGIARGRSNMAMLLAVPEHVRAAIPSAAAASPRLLLARQPSTRTTYVAHSAAAPFMPVAAAFYTPYGQATAAVPYTPVAAAAPSGPHGYVSRPSATPQAQAGAYGQAAVLSSVPAAAASPSASSAVPPGWERIEEDGDIYFLEERTGTTVWTLWLETRRKGKPAWVDLTDGSVHQTLDAIEEDDVIVDSRGVRQRASL